MNVEEPFLDKTDLDNRLKNRMETSVLRKDSVLNNIVPGKPMLHENGRIHQQRFSLSLLLYCKGSPEAKAEVLYRILRKGKRGEGPIPFDEPVLRECFDYLVDLAVLTRGAFVLVDDRAHDPDKFEGKWIGFVDDVFDVRAQLYPQQLQQRLANYASWLFEAPSLRSRFLLERECLLYVITRSKQ